MQNVYSAQFDPALTDETFLLTKGGSTARRELCVGSYDVRTAHLLATQVVSHWNGEMHRTIRAAILRVGTLTRPGRVRLLFTMHPTNPGHPRGIGACTSDRPCS